MALVPPPAPCREAARVAASTSAVLAPCPRFGAMAWAASPSSTTFCLTGLTGGAVWMPCTRVDARSEEHTSELQSRFDLVCRLLLEKKKRKKDNGQTLQDRQRSKASGRRR